MVLSLLSLPVGGTLPERKNGSIGLRKNGKLLFCDISSKEDKKASCCEKIFIDCEKLHIDIRLVS